jgi:hypothetical protein
MKKANMAADYELISNFKHGDLDIEMDFHDDAKVPIQEFTFKATTKFSFLIAGVKRGAKYNDATVVFTSAGMTAKPEGEKRAMKVMHPVSM